MLPSFSLETFFSNFGSTQGPFLTERDILFAAARNNKTLRPFFLSSRLDPARSLAPAVNRASASAKLPSLASPIRMIYRIHGRPTHGRTNSHQARPPCLSDHYQIRFLVRGLADRSPSAF